MYLGIRTLAFTAGLLYAASHDAVAQRGGQMSDSAKAKRGETENELQSVAVVNRKVMIPMRDGVLIPADIYRPKDPAQRYAAIWSRTPYNFNFWDVANGVPRDMTTALTAVKRGYAYVEMQERGHFFAGGNYDILGAPLTDGDDELTWLTKQS
ncbi:MAG TPA: CocE/NonD family hydrolase, partial [Gemmatimonadaceae bacterium]